MDGYMVKLLEIDIMLKQLWISIKNDWKMIQSTLIFLAKSEHFTKSLHLRVYVVRSVCELYFVASNVNYHPGYSACA